MEASAEVCASKNVKGRGCGVGVLDVPNVAATFHESHSRRPNEKESAGYSVGAVLKVEVGQHRQGNWALHWQHDLAAIDRLVMRPTEPTDQHGLRVVLMMALNILAPTDLARERHEDTALLEHAGVRSALNPALLLIGKFGILLTVRSHVVGVTLPASALTRTARTLTTRRAIRVVIASHLSFYHAWNITRRVPHGASESRNRRSASSGRARPR